VDNDPQPGIVECTFSDADGREWKFVAKFYDFTNVDLWSDSIYPQPGFVACEILSRDTDKSGREIAEIDTDKPDRGRDSVDGVSQFRVFADQLEADRLPAWSTVPLKPLN
jgi:hypothetical protein